MPRLSSGPLVQFNTHVHTYPNFEFVSLCTSFVCLETRSYLLAKVLVQLAVLLTSHFSESLDYKFVPFYAHFLTEHIAVLNMVSNCLSFHRYLSVHGGQTKHGNEAF